MKENKNTFGWLQPQSIFSRQNHPMEDVDNCKHLNKMAERVLKRTQKRKYLVNYLEDSEHSTADLFGYFLLCHTELNAIRKVSKSCE